MMRLLAIAAILGSCLGIVMHHADGFAFSLQITIWLWFTLLFANFAEAMAEGRGKAQADSLRATRRDVNAKQLEEGRYGRIIFDYEGL